jgi:very-short-patch-repair endonuclease
MRTFVREGRVTSEHASFKVYAPAFYDPYWFVTGSEPEKMVMAALAERGIFFEYRNQENSLGGFVDPTWEADILVPQHKIWIEVQGAYYHTLPGQLKNDAVRWASIKQAGWRPLFWWEWDIRTRLNELLDAVPEFYRVNLQRQRAAREKYGTVRTVLIDGKKVRIDYGTPFSVGSMTDQLVGHRLAMSNRSRPAQFAVKRRDHRVRK